MSLDPLLPILSLDPVGNGTAWFDPKLGISLRQYLWEKDGQKCHWCQKPTHILKFQAPNQATIDHILPRWRGGGSEESNLVSACHECNNRRSHEDTKGLAEGSMLGKFKMNPNCSVNYPGKPLHKKYVVLTGDEKRALMNGSAPVIAMPVRTPQTTLPVEDVLRIQRDQAQKEIASLRKELKHYQAVVLDQEQELKAMTVTKLIRKRLIAWLTKQDA